MVLPVVGPAKRHYKFVAVFAPHSSGLGKAKVMGIGRAAAAQQARLQGDKVQVAFIPMAANLAEREHALVDLAGSGVDLDECSLMPRQSQIGFVLAKRTLSRAPAELGLFWQTAPALHRYPISGFSPPSSIAHARLQSPHDARRRLVRQ